MSMTVEGRIDAEQIWRVSEGRVEHARVGKDGRGGSGRYA